MTKFYGKCDSEFKATNLCFFIHTAKLISFVALTLVMTFSCASSLPVADMSTTKITIYENDIPVVTTLAAYAHSPSLTQIDYDQSLDYYYSTCYDTNDLFACYAVSYLQQHNHI